MVIPDESTDVVKCGSPAGGPGRRARAVLLGLWIAVLATGGCTGRPTGAPTYSPGSLGARSGGKPIAPAELDELTRAFADRYVGLLSSSCDALKEGNPDPVQRREAQDLVLNCAANVYDIASNADAFTRMLDLVVVTTLVSQVWIDDDRASQVFGERANVLVRALHHGRVEAWALAAQVLRPDQLDLLDYLIWDWRRHNPDMTRASFVRFSNFALGRGRSADADVVAAGGFFSNIGRTGQSIDEARMLSERMFYLLKRYPTLLQWHVAAMKDDLLATPEVGEALADVRRLTDQVERLPDDVAAERQAILAAVDERMADADPTLAGVTNALTEADKLVTSMGRTGAELESVLKTGEPLFARFDAWQRWSADQPGHRPFDVREYTEGMKQFDLALGKLNDLLQSSNELLASSEWDRRVEKVSQSADGRINMASEQSQRVVDVVFWRVCLVIGVFFAALVLCRLTTLLLTRWLGVNAEKAARAAARGGNGQDLRTPARLANHGGLSR